VERAYQDWQVARADLEKWNLLAEKFRDQEKVRQEPLARIGEEQARLEQERDGLLHQQTIVNEGQIQLAQLENELVMVQSSLSRVETQLKARGELEKSKVIIARFRDQARLRQAPLAEINSEKARLEQELKTLEKQRELAETQQSALKKLQIDLGEVQSSLIQAETQLNLRKSLEQDLKNKKELQFILNNSNDRLKLEMESLNERIKKLEVTEGALCPLCGQPLSPVERQKLIDSLRFEGREKGDEFRKNKSELEALLREIVAVDKEILTYGRVEKDHLFHVTNITKIGERIEANQLAVKEWELAGAPRLAEVKKLLDTESYSPQAHQHLLRIERELQAIGKALGLKVSSKNSIFDIIEEKVVEIENELTKFKDLDEERMQYNTHATQLTEQANTLRNAYEDWNTRGKTRLEGIVEMLLSSNFALPERKKLALIDTELKKLGYDAQAHDAVRMAEQAGRSSENDLRELEAARAALFPLRREMEDLKNQVDGMRLRLETSLSDLTNSQNTLEALKASTPDLRQAETALFDAQERENILTREVGAAQQKVKVLQDLRLRKANFEKQREDIARQIKDLKTLERAFGKDGVPALLIEQALPQIEDKANELLDRLTNGSMSVRFVTQAEFKDKKRDDLKETLDIRINDGVGTRDYEMFSGGEAFRVNFAIRLALSEVLARRTGARLQTLVIDEGFGSQDTEGRQRLVEAINQVKSDFAKILIITHLDELKDAFPNRIEVEKTPGGSSVRVM